MRQLGIAVSIATVALVLGACGSSGSPAPSGGGASAGAPSGATCTVAADATTAASTVTIRDFAFGPASVTIKAGQAIAWTNADSASHTATTLDGGCDTGTLPKGATVALVFPTAGTYTYHCKIHASMAEATVQVTP